jgi:capsule polysaccharide export protein KpsE/RkpR
MKKAENVKGFTLTPAHIMLISMLTDKIITLTATLKTVSSMSDEQALARIAEEEALTKTLLGLI